MSQRVQNRVLDSPSKLFLPTSPSQVTATPSFRLLQQISAMTPLLVSYPTSIPEAKVFLQLSVPPECIQRGPLLATPSIIFHLDYFVNLPTFSSLLPRSLQKVPVFSPCLSRRRLEQAFLKRELMSFSLTEPSRGFPSHSRQRTKSRHSAVPNPLPHLSALRAT